MLFKKEHKEMILKGTKTATRRCWKKPMVKVGGIYKCKEKMLSKDYFAKIIVTKLFKQRIGEMTLKDVKKEGYSSGIEFAEVFAKINKINKNNRLHGNKKVYVIEFELVKENK